MTVLELVLISVSLAMDAFTVSIAKGLGMSRLNMRQAVIIALFFGGFQAGMPAIGYALGVQLSGIIEPIDHWIAFVLLAAIGSKMIFDAFHPDDDEAKEMDAALNMRELVLLAIATSIDALAVGITFSFLEVNIVLALVLIGVITFALSFVGVACGHQIGLRFEKASSIAGGVVLILIGLHILLEHLGIIAF